MIAGQLFKEGEINMKGILVIALRAIRRLAIAVIAIVLLAVALPATLGTSVYGHGQSLQARKPNAELHTANDYFVGTWTLTGETKPSPFGPGGQKFTATEQLEWIPGGFFLVARSYEGNQWRGMTIIAYDETAKVFTHTTYNANGEIEVLKGTAQGDTETWYSDRQVKGKTVKQRMTIKKVSPVLYTFKFEMAPEGGGWSVVYEGQGSKNA
jgi:hypothetical protein